MQAIIQGKIYRETYQVVNNLLSTNFIQKVIVSCWENDIFNQFDKEDERIKVIKSKPPQNPGITNRNLQIVSSFAGVAAAEPTGVIAKFRSDQIISIDSLNMMNRFYQKFKEENDGKIFVLGNFFSLVFHPNDHVFWGEYKDIYKLFDIPLDTQVPVQGEQYNKYTRSECYIASFYYASLYPEVQKMVENPKEYLIDGAPKYQESLNLSNQLRGKVFKVFPKIQLCWPKHSISSYPYEKQAVWEEWAQNDWE